MAPLSIPLDKQQVDQVEDIVRLACADSFEAYKALQGPTGDDSAPSLGAETSGAGSSSTGLLDELPEPDFSQIFSEWLLGLDGNSTSQENVS